MADVMTGRVFAANGPWVTRDGDDAARGDAEHARAPPRRGARTTATLLGELAEAARLALAIADNPHRWEGMADVAAVGDRVVLTYAVPGHYDARHHAEELAQLARGRRVRRRSSPACPTDARIYAELVYPHFHGDTVHFGARPTTRRAGARPLRRRALRRRRRARRARARRRARSCRSIATTRSSSTPATRARSRGGVLVPDGVSPAFVAAIEALGLAIAPRPAVRAVRQGRRRPGVRDPVPAPHPRRTARSRRCATRHPRRVRARRERIPETPSGRPRHSSTGKARG